MQRLFYGDRSHALLIVLQGIDGAGKDGTCWHVISAMDPQGVKVQGFKQPTPEEKAHDFLWRVHPHAPAKGEVAVFNRSHYEDVLVVRVHKLVPKPVWQARYDFINEWEKLLHEREQHDDPEVLSLHLEGRAARPVQGAARRSRRGSGRSAIPTTSERDYWDDYIDAFEDALTKCSKKHAPWYVIPSNHKWFRNLAVSQIIADTMDDMNLKLPKPTVDLAEDPPALSRRQQEPRRRAAQGTRRKAAQRLNADGRIPVRCRPRRRPRCTRCSTARRWGAGNTALWFLASGGTLLDGFSIFSLGVAMPLVTRHFALSAR